MSYIFQYGSNTSVERLNSDTRLKGSAKLICTAYTVCNYEFDFTVWSKTNKCAAADIVPNGGRQIWGVIYDIPDELIARSSFGNRKSLDSIEGKNYDRILINVLKNDGTPILDKVQTYMVNNRKNGLETSLQYASTIINGLKDHKDIPTDYIKYVKEKIILNNPVLKNKLPFIS